MHFRLVKASSLLAFGNALVVGKLAYIGQRKLDLKSRLDEHERVINLRRPEKSAFCVHYIIVDHRKDGY